ncbi:MAG: hypothetical protein HY735_16210 [Verrucomicrobia bacterium]|nr:hypothetical protein [Verrucomicrobiota bacterium]
MRVLLAARARDRASILKLLDKLVINPYQKGHFTEKDEDGRDLQVLVARPWTVTFWLDAFVKEIRIVRIERI